MYEIVVRGRLPADWEYWFDQFTVEVTVTPDGPVSTLIGPVPDQAALHGALARVRDMALPVISVSLLPGSDSERTAPANTSSATPPDT